MRKLFLMFAMAGLTSGAALAEAPKGLLERPPAQVYPGMSGGTAQQRAATGSHATGSLDTISTVAPTAADINGDGYLSAAERQAWAARSMGAGPAMPAEPGLTATERRIGEMIRGTPK